MTRFATLLAVVAIGVGHCISLAIAAAPDEASQRYTIDTPDLLWVKVAQFYGAPDDADATNDRNPLTRGIHGQHIVNPEGAVQLGPLGNVRIAGKTVADAAKAIEKRLEDAAPGSNFAVEVDVVKYNSRRVYVVVQQPNGHDNVMLYVFPGDPATTQTTVDKVLSQTSWPNPINFANATITVRRPAGPYAEADEQTLNVKWNAATGRPTEETNRRLQPGDRLVVKVPAPPATIHSAPVPLTTAVGAPAQAQTISGFLAAETQITQVLCKIQLIEDLHGSLQSFAPIRDGGKIVGDSDSLLGALNILQNNNLTRVHASPNAVFVVGRSLNLSIPRELPPDERGDGKSRSVELEFSARQHNGKLRYSLSARVGDGQQPQDVRANAFISDGQTLIARCDVDSKKPLYVVLTPETVDPIVTPATVQAAMPPLTPPPAYMPYAMAPVTPTPVQAQWMGPALLPPQLVASSYSAPDNLAAAQYVTPTPGPAPLAVASEWRNKNPPQVKYAVDILEDRSGSLADLLAGNSPPIEMADSRSTQTMLRVLERQKLIAWQSRPRIISIPGEPATFQIGNESPNEDQPFSGLKGELVGRALGGGVAVVFTMRHTVNGKEAKFSLDTIVPAGQCVIMKAGSRSTKESGETEVVATDDGARNEEQYPVYVVLTPELLK